VRSRNGRPVKKDTFCELIIPCDLYAGGIGNEELQLGRQKRTKTTVEFRRGNALFGHRHHNNRFISQHYY